MFTDPTQPGFFREGLFENRSAVGKGAQLYLAAAFVDAPRERAQTTAHDLVIIAPQGIARDVAEIGLLEDLQRLCVGRLVVHSRDNGATTAGHELRRIEAQLDAAFEILHFAVSSLSEPLLVALAIKA